MSSQGGYVGVTGARHTQHPTCISDEWILVAMNSICRTCIELDDPCFFITDKTRERCKDR